ncbi:MAG: hypothetical protein JSW55_00560 [Chloroflexota bacterium]|nr:MAG: hypothetical protein JSW55_00560 [Chloroflexota bacterium]
MTTHRLTLDEPATYCICVQGSVGEDWSDYLGGLEISLSKQDPLVTKLRGQVMDQAALIGIINGLYDLGFPLLSVEFEPAS